MYTQNNILNIVKGVLEYFRDHQIFKNIHCVRKYFNVIRIYTSYYIVPNTYLHSIIHNIMFLHD